MKILAVFIFSSLVWLQTTSISTFAQEPPPSIHELMLAAHRDEAPVVLEKVSSLIPLQNRVTGLSHQVYGYLPYWSSYAALDYSLLSTIAFFSIEIDGNGNITNRHGWPNADLINRAHSRGVRIDLVATLFDENAIHNVIANGAARERFISDQPLAATTNTGTARFYSVAEGLAAQYGKLLYAPGQVPWFKYQNTGWRQCYSMCSANRCASFLTNGKPPASIAGWSTCEICPPAFIFSACKVTASCDSKSGSCRNESARA